MSFDALTIGVDALTLKPWESSNLPKTLTGKLTLLAATVACVGVGYALVTNHRQKVTKAREDFPIASPSR